MKNKENYKTEREKYFDIYKNFKTSYCKAFESEIVYNAKGFSHIIYKTGNKERGRNEQLQRFQYLELAKEFLEHTNTFQEYEYLKENNIYYWGLIAIYKNIKLKVIIKRNGENGKYYFYSVIPNFVTSPKRDKK
jgi:hypothetical protein